MQLVETLSLRGFRSIKELNNFTLGPITVLVGANGSGKSNLIGFFRMMNAMMQGGTSTVLTNRRWRIELSSFRPRANTLPQCGTSFPQRFGVEYLSLRIDFCSC